jgi:hypothetical protein
MTFIFTITLFVNTVDAKWVHPRNKIIQKLEPRSAKLRFPHIPRIRASRALQLYKQGKAFFIHVGEAGGNVPGCLHISEKTAWSLNPGSLMRKIPQKYVILY